VFEDLTKCDDLNIIAHGGDLLSEG
jgi:hypothetical protein